VNCQTSSGYKRLYLVYLGGLGMRKVSSLVLPAYLASAASTASLQNTIFEPVTPSEDEMLSVYLGALKMQEWKNRER